MPNTIELFYNNFMSQNYGKTKCLTTLQGWNVVGQKLNLHNFLIGYKRIFAGEMIEEARMKTLKETDNEYICDLSAPCFQALSVEDVSLVQSSKTQVLFRKGDNLTKQGTFASYVLFVVKGLAVQYVEGDGRKSYNLRIIKPGEFVGLFSIFSKNIFNYSSVALTDCHVILVEKETITQIMDANGAFALGLIRRYSEQNINLFDTLRIVIFKQMHARFAEALLYIDGFKAEYPDVFQWLSRKDIADFAGISIESAVKLLKSLEKEHFIELNTKDISILDYEKLRDISNLK